MITSSSISYISQMLEEPQNLSHADAESIRILTETYPYFVPARYMQAAQQHKVEPYTPEMMTTMQLFSGNWLQYNAYLQSASGGEEVEFTTPIAHEGPKRQPVATAAASAIADEEIEDILDEADPEVAETLPDEDIYEEAVAPKEHFNEGFNPANTGFIRGKKASTPPPPPQPLQEEPAEDLPTAAIPTEPVAEPLPPKKQKDSPFASFIDKTDWDEKSENLIPPIYTEDYFLHQGMHVSNELPEDIGNPDHTLAIPVPEKSLMVVMSFAEWLMFYNKKKQQAQEEEKDQRELKTMWQKEKLAAALEEENEEIPENVFEMAVNSITKEESLISESLAEVLVKQGRYDRAIEMYKKLSLHKPQKKAYFARKIEEILKEK